MKTLFFALFLSVLLPRQSRAQFPTWYEVLSGTTAHLAALSFGSDLVGYAVGYDTTILKTTDGGATWFRLSHEGINQHGHYADVWFVNETIGYLTMQDVYGAYKTADGGLNWVPVGNMSSNMCYARALYFSDENNGFMGGSGCFQGELIDRIDGGVWSAATINGTDFDATKRIVSIDFMGNMGLAASASGYMFRSTDGGHTWDSIYASQNTLTSVAFFDADTVYAGYISQGVGFGILRSTDAGLTWAEDMNSATFFYPDYLCVHRSGDGKLYSGARPAPVQGLGYGLIFERGAQDGDAWLYAQVAQPINGLAHRTDSIVFGVGDSGLIVVNRPLVASIEHLAQAPSTISLYPNPARSEVFLQVPGAEGALFVELFSLSGQRLLACSLNDQCLSLEGVQPGVYALCVSTSGQRKQYVKLVIH